MSTVIAWLLDLKYLAMFGILFLCGLGLPIPEEITLVGSGLLVGWGEADFLIASVACVVGILAGDSIIFGLGYTLGDRFLNSRPMHFFLSPWRQAKVARFFDKHGSKAVFFARFFAGVRIGVYAYAGSQRMFWPRFLFLDLLGALISGPTSIFIGKVAAENLVSDRQAAAAKAARIVHEFGHYLLLGAVLLVAGFVLFHIWLNRRAARKMAAKASARAAALPGAPPPAAPPSASPAPGAPAAGHGRIGPPPAPEPKAGEGPATALAAAPESRTAR